MKDGKKTIRVKVGAEIVPVEIDENTTAKELVRKVIPDDLKRYIRLHTLCCFRGRRCLKK